MGLGLDTVPALEAADQVRVLEEALVLGLDTGPTLEAAVLVLEWAVISVAVVLVLVAVVLVLVAVVLVLEAAVEQMGEQDNLEDEDASVPAVVLLLGKESCLFLPLEGS